MPFLTQGEIVVGIKFKSAGKHPNTCTVTDILRTYNSKNELVKVRFCASHIFMGMTVNDNDVCAVTIQRGYIW